MQFNFNFIWIDCIEYYIEILGCSCSIKCNRIFDHNRVFNSIESKLTVVMLSYPAIFEIVNGKSNIIEMNSFTAVYSFNLFWTYMCRHESVSICCTARSSNSIVKLALCMGFGWISSWLKAMNRYIIMSSFSFCSFVVINNSLQLNW